MKDEVTWRGEVYEMEWFDDVDFEGLDGVAQVYGFVFDDEGRICITKGSIDNWTMPGGGVEDYDETFEDTLIREVDEEVDLVLKDIRRVGYLKITPKSENCSKGVHYAVRYVARVKEMKEQTIDPCHDRIGERKFVLPEEFGDYVKWGKTGDFQIAKAVEVLGKE